MSTGDAEAKNKMLKSFVIDSFWFLWKAGFELSCQSHAIVLSFFVTTDSFRKDNILTLLGKGTQGILYQTDQI
jgi:hypothetical protein